MDRKQIIDRLPEHLKVIREFKYLSDTEQKEVDSMWLTIDNAFKDQFVAEATETGIERYEKIFSVVPRGVGTLKERRFRILTKITEKLPYSVRMLKKQLESLCGAGNYGIALMDYTLTVWVGLIAKSNFEAVKKMIYNISPSNLCLKVYVKYNSNEIFKGYTHKDLKKYTHYQLRNEVLINGD